MNNDKFRQLIEAADLTALKVELASKPEWANQSISWYLNQSNQSDPLHYVCACVFNDWLVEAQATEVANLLIQHGALIEGTRGRESPLIGATSLGVETVAKLLIDAGAKLESTSVFGGRALHWAASVGLPSTVELLIQQGAEIEAKCTEFASTPLFWAVFGFGPNGPNKKRDPLGAAHMLLEAGAEVHTTNKEGVSALECAQMAASNEMYELLLRYTNHL